MGGPTGTAVIEAIASSPPRGPALALIDGHGEVVRLTESFRAGFAPEGSDQFIIWDFLADPAQRKQLGRVLEGRLLRADLALPSAAGSVAAEAEAVLDDAVTRHALLTVAAAGSDPEPRAGVDVLLDDPSLENSPAIVWIKDLSGRYLRVNRSYATHLGIDQASIAGKSDADLAPVHVVASPRLIGQRGEGPEPMQLEYTVPATGGRDALTALRFPLHGRDGSAVAVCGVAADIAEAATARSEAERLLRIERWAGLSVRAIRAELIEEWHLAELAEPEEPALPATNHRPGRPPESGPSARPNSSSYDASWNRPEPRLPSSTPAWARSALPRPTSTPAWARSALPRPTSTPAWARSALPRLTSTSVSRTKWGASRSFATPSRPPPAGRTISTAERPLRLGTDRPSSKRRSQLSGHGPRTPSVRWPRRARGPRRA